MQSKVSFFMPGFYGGGGEKAMIEIAKEFSKKRINVEIVVVKNEGELKKEVPKNIEVKNLKKSKIILSVVPLMRYLRQKSPSAIIGAMTTTNNVLYTAAQLSGYDGGLILCEQNNFSSNLRKHGWVKRHFLEYASRLSYNKCDNTIAVSKGVKNNLNKYLNINADNISVVYNPVVNSKTFDKAKETVNVKWFDQSKKIIIAVGSMTEQKDFPTLLKAFNMVSSSKEVLLVVLGEGPGRQKLTKLAKALNIENKVIMPGYVSNPIKYMANADVFVLSSKWEGLPFVLVEALASGCPVISTDCPSGPEEILRGGKLGRLVPVTDERSLAEAILDTLKSPNSSADKKRRIRRAKDFSVQAAARKYWSIVEQYV